MNDHVSIREARPGDIPEMVEIYNHWMAPAERLAARTLRDELTTAGKRERYLVLIGARGVTGWGSLKRYSPRGGYRYSGETKVYLHHVSLRKGHGTRIKQALIKAARSLEYHHLLARVTASNTAAISYNVNLGYEVVGVQKEICNREGRWEDIVVLQYIVHRDP